MDRLICTACHAEVGADEVVCPDCRALLTTEGAVRVVTAEPGAGGPGHAVTARTTAPSDAPPRTPVAMPTSPERTTCPHCRTPVTSGDPICLVCLRELSAVLLDTPRGEALLTTLERESEAATLRLSFSTGEVVVKPGQQVVLGRDARHTATAARLAPFDNVSRTHATVGLMEPPGSATRTPPTAPGPTGKPSRPAR
ncbi:hypothetical protein SALBM135S_09624 [Streptomyces alboniger]